MTFRTGYVFARSEVVWGGEGGGGRIIIIPHVDCFCNARSSTEVPRPGLGLSGFGNDSYIVNYQYCLQSILRNQLGI